MPNKKSEIGHLTIKNKARRLIWNLCQTLFFRPAILPLMWPWRWFWLRLFGAKISHKANVYASVKIWAPWNLHMESGSCLGPHVICYNQAEVRLLKDSTVSQYAYLCAAGHSTSETNNPNSGLIVAPITIGEGAWVGTQAYIGMGVIVGNHAVVGARAAVYKDVDPKTVVGGNPAKIIKTID